MIVGQKERLLEMLSYMDGICNRHQLRYFAIGGTFLGAIRHKGFIPWDDDIDVALPRNDFDKFAEIVNSDDSKYVVETPQSKAKDFVYTTGKLYDTSTTLIEAMKIQVERGLYIDIFPMDGIGNSITEVKRNHGKIDLLGKLIATRTCIPRRQRAWYKNLAIFISNLIPEKICDTKKMVLEFDRLCRQIGFDEAKYVGVLGNPYGMRYIMSRELFLETVRYPFESQKISGVADYDKYLSILFGDWRMLPPIEQRVESHDSVYINLNRPYIKQRNCIL